MKTLVATLVIVSFSSCFVSAQEISWETDLTRAAQRSATSNKPLMLHFSADWCRDCKQLDTFVFSNPVFARAIQETVIPVRVDVDRNSTLVREHAITSIPMDVIITNDGRVLAKQLSPRHVDDYVRMLEKLPPIMSDLSAPKYGQEQVVQGILASANVNTDPVLNRNDFAPPVPSHAPPAISANGRRLQEQFVNKRQPFAVGQGGSPNQRIGLEQIQQASNDHRREMDSVFRKKGPQRIVNDTFDSGAAVESRDVGARKGSSFTEPFQQSESQTITNPFVMPSNGPRSASLEGSRELNRAVGFETETPIEKRTQSRADFVAQAGVGLVQRSISGTSQTAPSEQRRFVGSQQDASMIRPAEVKGFDRFAMFGQCPVSLTEASQWVDGDPHLGVSHRGRIFLFANQENLIKFQQKPDHYCPVLVGFDPVMFHKTGLLVEGKAEHGVFMGSGPSQRVILFCTDSAREEFQRDPATFLRTVKVAMGRGVPVDGIQRR